MAYILTDKPKRTAGNAWLERVNPLHGLTIAQARNIFDVARAHGSPLLQKIYDEIELVDPVLGVCVDRRQAALAELGWKISPRPSADQVLADEQKDALDAFVRGIGNFSETVEHLDLAFFRGFSVVQPIWDGDAVHTVSLLETWNFLFDDDRRLLWNPDCTLDPRGCFEIPAAARIVQVRRRRPIDYPALAIHIRKYLGERDWGRFIERYGIPPVDVVMAPNATNEQKADYVDAAEAARDGRSTVWPSGTPQPSRAEGSRGQDPFTAFIEHQEKLIVLRATGGTLTSLAQADTGTLAGGAQMDVWDQIVMRDSSVISDALNRQLFWKFLERRFPGRAPAVEFSIGRERELTANDAADLAVKLHGAGYTVAQAELEEATGFTLEKAPAPEQPGDPFAGRAGAPRPPLLNKEPSSINHPPTAPRAPDNAILEAFAKDQGAAAEAVARLLQNPTPDRAAALLKDLPNLLPEDPALAAVIAEEMAKAYGEAWEKARKEAQSRGGEEEQAGGELTQEEAEKLYEEIMAE
jgi:phage gp29-like protein